MSLYFDTSITQEHLKSLFNYDEQTGLFFRFGSDKPVGSFIPKTGYVRINIGLGKIRFAHRLAWVYYYGLSPLGEIDHINGNRSDNRISNLRDVSRSENQWNQRKAQKQTSSGFLGVGWHPQSKKWQASIQVKGKSKYLGLFDDPALAHEAYLAAKRVKHETCTI